MEILLVAILVLLVLACTGLIVVRRRHDATLEPPPREVLAPTEPAEEGAPVDDVLPVEVEEPVAVEAPPAAPVRPRFRDRLGKARSTLSGYMGAVLAREKIDSETWDDLEEALLLADVGVAASTSRMRMATSRISMAPSSVEGGYGNPDRRESCVRRRR